MENRDLTSFVEEFQKALKENTHDKDSLAKVARELATFIYSVDTRKFSVVLRNDIVKPLNEKIIEVRKNFHFDNKIQELFFLYSDFRKSLFTSYSEFFESSQEYHDAIHTIDLLMDGLLGEKQTLFETERDIFNIESDYFESDVRYAKRIEQWFKNTLKIQPYYDFGKCKLLEFVGKLRDKIKDKELEVQEIQNDLTELWEKYNTTDDKETMEIENIQFLGDDSNGDPQFTDSFVEEINEAIMCTDIKRSYQEGYLDTFKSLYKSLHARYYFVADRFEKDSDFIKKDSSSLVKQNADENKDEIDESWRKNLDCVIVSPKIEKFKKIERELLDRRYLSEMDGKLQWKETKYKLVDFCRLISHHEFLRLKVDLQELIKFFEGRYNCDVGDQRKPSKYKNHDKRKTIELISADFYDIFPS